MLLFLLFLGSLALPHLSSSAQVHLWIQPPQILQYPNLYILKLFCLRLQLPARTSAAN